MPKERVDKVLVERGLAESRTRAQAIILAGQVLVGEQRADKPGQMIDVSAAIRIKGKTQRYVSRGGLKLEAALAGFSINPESKLCIDVGASTGGFTDCLLQHGAARVWAIDVGHNQIAWAIRQDSRVEVIEGFNARNFDPRAFPCRFQIATVDVSFISLAKILSPLASILDEDVDAIVLVKPQFEVGKGEVGRGGIVTDPLKHRRVLGEIKEAALAASLHPAGLIASPILGAEGNREFLMWLSRSKNDKSETADLEERIRLLTGA